MAALGVPIYSAIAVALGVFGCDPQATEARQRVKPSYMYLYMLLSGLYGYAFFAPHWWQSLVSIVLAVLLAQALWQSINSGLAEVSESEGLREAIVRDEELSSGAVVGRSHEEVTQAARRALGCA